MAARMDIVRELKRRRRSQFGPVAKRQRRFGVRPFFPGFPGIRRRNLFGTRSRSLALRNLRTGGLLSIEKKFLDVAIAPVALVAPTDASGGELQPDAGCIGCLSAPAQGDGPTQRDGKEIALMSIEVKGNVRLVAETGLATLSADSVPSVFLAIVMDTQTNGVTINSEDVFTNISGEATAAGQPFRNMSNTSRFRVLKTTVLTPADFATVMAANNAAATTISFAGTQVPFHLYASLKGIKVNFTTASTTADVANVVNNSIHLIGFTTSTTMAPSIVGASRMRFIG